MRFVPMKFCSGFITIRQSDERISLHLAPTAASVRFSQPFNITNPTFNCDDLNIFNRAENLKHFHAVMMQLIGL